MYSRNNKADDINGSHHLFEFTWMCMSVLSTLPLRTFETMFFLIYSAIGYLPLLDQKERKLNKNKKSLNWSYITEGKKMKNRRAKNNTIPGDVEEIRLAKMLEDIKRKVAGVDANVVEVNMFTQDLVGNRHDVQAKSVIDSSTNNAEPCFKKVKPQYERELESALKDVQFYAKKDLGNL